MERICIVAAKRTPQGRLSGALAKYSATELAIEAGNAALEQIGKKINEAFAAQILVCVKEMGIDTERLNPNGGAIALGHPIGASGARLPVHMAHRIARGEISNGLATLCVGAGMGVAMVIESV